MKVKVYNLEHKEVGDLELSDEVFEVDASVEGFGIIRGILVPS